MVSTKQSEAPNRDHAPSDDDLRAPPTIFISGRFKSAGKMTMGLDQIQTLEDLTNREQQVIDYLKHHSGGAKASQARAVIEQFRRESVKTQHLTNRNKPMSQPTHQPFDRLIYLLERYTEYCRSIGLSAWPVHHWKVAIWIKGDVISLKTRVIPLRKTVRCYITTMETVRLKTYHLFWDNVCHEKNKKLMTSTVLKELLDVLPITRSRSLESEGSRGQDKELGGVDRDVLLETIRKYSGDERASEALAVVRTARGKTDHTGAWFENQKPDPHIHTLNRYQLFCRFNRIPIWPIEPLRVSLWLKESVLSAVSPEYNGFKVSLRTVQVYLSRLEYARLRTEPIFASEFGDLATSSLYRSQAIMDVLESFAPNRQGRLSFMNKVDENDIDFENIEESRPETKNEISGFQRVPKRKAPDHLFSLLGEEEHGGFCNVFASRLRMSKCRGTLEGPDVEDSAESLSGDSGSSSGTRSRSLSCDSSDPAPSDFEGSDTTNSSQYSKGRLSYILCSENDPVTHSGSRKEIVASTHPYPAYFTLSPILIPQSPMSRLRATVPSLESFSLALGAK